jgi:ectoine hydroxylase-related dioxygenase (phytanoyl-CoA dioxygenase family)
MSNTVDISVHAAAVIERGYTVIPSQVDPEQIMALNAAADRALDKVSRAMSEGVKPAHTQLNPHVRSARCFYTWDEASRRLLEHPTVHALGKAVLGHAKLWEMTVLEALPMPKHAELGPFDWHRDFSAASHDGLQQAYLWIFTCLTDVTPENGATWVLPGSHKNISLAPPSMAGSDQEHASDAVQLTARAGDIVAINPVMLHRVGENRTRAGRRLALVGLCRSDRCALLNHWAIAGTSLRDRMPDAVRALLRNNDCTLDESWDVLPDGWAVAKTPPVERALRRLVRKGATALSDPRRVLRRLNGGVKTR